MKTSADGRAAIRREEGEKLTAYLDTAKPPVLTIGVGHTSAAGPPTVTKGMKITAAQSDAILAQDLGDVEADINRLVKVPLTQPQFDAIVSLVFNIGVTAFRKSSVLKKLNAADHSGAADAFLLYKMAGGKPQLLARRQRERAMFLSVPPVSGSEVIPAPVDLADGKYHEELERVQSQLNTLGYPEIGTVDGKWGTKTQAAVLAFKADNGLPTDPSLDTAFLAALAIGKKRPIAAARANATVDDLRKDGAADIQQTDQTKIGGAALTTGGVAVGAIQGLGAMKDASGTAKSIWDDLQPVQNFIVDNIWIILIVGGLFFVWKSGIIQKIRLEKHQTGQDVSV